MFTLLSTDRNIYAKLEHNTPRPAATSRIAVISHQQSPYRSVRNTFSKTVSSANFFPLFCFLWFPFFHQFEVESRLLGA